jgi:hypothetical protein
MYEAANAGSRDDFGDFARQGVITGDVVQECGRYGYLCGSHEVVDKALVNEHIGPPAPPR